MIMVMVIVIMIMIFELVVMVRAVTDFEIIRDLPQQRMTDLCHFKAGEQFFLVTLLRVVREAISIDIFHVELRNFISLYFI